MPRRVLESAACKSLTHGEFRVLVLYAAQFAGGNNGSLALTRSQAATFGVGHTLLQRAQKTLEDRGLLRLTRHGMRTPPTPHRFAVTWEGIDGGKHDARPNPVPSREFADWAPKSISDDSNGVMAMTQKQSRDSPAEPTTVTQKESWPRILDDSKEVTSKNLPYGTGILYDHESARGGSKTSLTRLRTEHPSKSFSEGKTYE